METTTEITPSQPIAAAEKGKSAANRAAQMILTCIWAIGSLFWSAGTFKWTRGWICVVMWLLLMPLIGIITQHANPELMKERAKWRRKDTKPFDKVLLRAFLPLVLIQPTVAGLDAVRYHWSSMPFACVYLGAAVFVLAAVLITWVLCVNPYAETSVRIQTDRGHKVVTTGPYRYVRHPMYVGAILMYFGPPLIWGSRWALVVTGAIGVLLIVRTALEDRTLQRELPGYAEYTLQTRYRLLPGIW